MKTHEVLKAARALIADEAHWCDGSNARRKDGAATLVNAPDAYSFCSAGALIRVCCPTGEFSDDLAAAHAALDSAARWLAESANLNRRSITGINDLYGHRLVLRMFDRAIENTTPTPKET